MALVNKGFNRIMFSEPALWRSLELGSARIRPDDSDDDLDLTPWADATAPTSDAELERQLNILPRVAGMVQHLSIGGESDHLVAAALASLDPATVTSLLLQLVCDQQTSLLPQLVWDQQAVQPPASMQATFQAVAQLTALSRLEVTCDMLPSAMCAALAALPRLSSLLLSDQYPWRHASSFTQLASGPAIARLAPQLTHLELTLHDEMPPLVAGFIAALSRLCRLKLHTSSFQPEVAVALSYLTALSALWLECSGSSPRLALAAFAWAEVVSDGGLQQLRSLRLKLRPALPSNLLAALVQQTQLTSLELHAGLSDVQQLTSLTGLRRLSLHHVHLEGQVDPPRFPLPCNFPALLTFSLFSEGQPCEMVGNGCALHKCLLCSRQQLHRLPGWSLSLAQDALVQVPMLRLVLKPNHGKMRLAICSPAGTTQSLQSALGGAWLYECMYNCLTTYHADYDTFWEAQDQAEPAVDPNAANLTVWRVSSMPSVDQLLNGLVPASAPLHSIGVFDAAPLPAAGPISPHTTALRSILAAAAGLGIFQSLPQLMPHLTSLELGGGAPPIGLQPSQLPSLPALRELSLIRRFDSTGGSAIDACMPTLLAQAPQLVSLSVQGSLGGFVVMTDEPVVEWASWADWPGLPAVHLPAPAWLAGLQGIQELTLHSNHLADLPAGPYLTGE